MAYPQYIMGDAIVKTSTNFFTAEVLTAAAAVYGSMMAHHPFYVTRFTFHISTAVSDLTASVIRLEKVSAANVTTAITNMTVPNGAAANKVYYVDCSPTKVGIGEKLQYNHLTQGGLGGTPAGAGFYGFMGHYAGMTYGNETSFVAG